MIIPFRLPFPKWLSYLSIDNPNANIPSWRENPDWRYIASVLIDDPQFSGFAPPAPDGYAAPEEWIQDFSRAIY